MAKEEAKPAEAPESQEAPIAPKKKGKFGLIGLVGGLMIVEGAGIFIVMKMVGSDPDPTVGMEQALVPTTKPWAESQEIPVAKVRVLNSSGSRAMLYNVRVVVRVHNENVERVDEFIKGRAGTVEDTIGRVIRSADERHLGEPGLETLKRQVRHELGKLLGDDSLIEQVLIPDCMPMPTGF
ncbi:hypothetical protein B7486_05880 [cyanobacterium TDX16]|jgi:flagellar basal body-associated protein FliL|nr:hypothetical protein B7486_05880 [cyanobacterium TDX16]